MVVADCCYKYDEDENVYNNDGDDLGTEKINDDDDHHLSDFCFFFVLAMKNQRQ